jgi:hypothetical protein
MPRFFTFAACVWIGLTGLPLFGQSARAVIGGLNPSTINAGSQGFTMIVSGANFATGAMVLWNESAIYTSFSNSSQLIAAVPAAYVAVPGTYSVSVINPGTIASVPVQFLVTASATITTTALPSGSVGASYTYSLTATGGVPPYTWRASGLPSGLSMTTGGTITGTPAAQGSSTVSVTVIDSVQQSSSKSLALTINGPSLSITTASPLPAAQAGQNYSVTFNAAGGTPPYKWSASGSLPAGLTLDSTSGTLSGRPTTAGTYSFTVQLSDAAQLSVSRAYTLTVPAPPLVITTLAPLFSGTVGAPYAQTFSASGGKPPYRWSVTSGDAGGLTLDSTSGTLQGSPQRAGTFSFTVQVTDADGTVASQPFAVVVTMPQLTITTGSSLPDASVGVPYTQVFSVTGGRAPYSWSLSGVSVPGLGFNPDSATLSGIPTTPGSFTISLNASDSSGLSAVKSFRLTVKPASLRITSELQLPNSIVGASISYPMTAIGGVQPYSWSANGLPSGLTIDTGSGLLGGTLAAAGSFAFTVRVTDSQQTSVVGLFRLNVDLPTPPDVTISGLAPILQPADQATLQVNLSAPYSVTISGQLILSFAPESGAGDGTVQFSSGGRTANFTIPSGTTQAVFAGGPLGIQTGTVSGALKVSARFQAAGVDLTPSSVPSVAGQIQRSAPVITGTQVIPGTSTLSIAITGYSTTLEMTQATFMFAAAPGNSLEVQSITVPVETNFKQWYEDPSSSRYGSQFTMTATFNIKGNVSLVIPQSVTLTNRSGSATKSIAP